MKKKILLTLAIIAVFTCLFAISISAAEEKDGIWYNFKVTNEEAKIGTAEVAIENATNCTLADVVIPSYIEKDGYTYTVTSIANHAFSGQPWGSNQTIKSLYIPETVSYIGEHILRQCTSIETVEIDARGAENISLSNANFYKCSNLKSVDLSESNVSSFNQYVFHGCSSLSDLKLPPKLTKIGLETFRSCSSLLGTMDLSGTKVTEIGNWAFNGCSKLEKVIFPSTLTKIGNNCFQGTSSLKALVFPDGFNSLANDAIAQISLDLVVFPELSSDHTIHNESFHQVGVKVLIYEGTNYETLTGEGKLFAGYTALPYSEYDSTKTYTKTLFYGATNLCSLCNGLYASEEEQFVFTDYTTDMKYGKLCSHCEKVVTTKTVAPMFTCLGWTAQIDGGAVSIRYQANRASIAEYTSETGNVVEYGMYATIKNVLGDNEIVGENGEAGDGAVMVSLSSAFVNLEIKLLGIGDDQKDTLFAIGAFVKETSNEVAEYKLLEYASPKDGDKYYFTSFNEIIENN